MEFHRNVYPEVQLTMLQKEKGYGSTLIRREAVTWNNVDWGLRSHVYVIRPILVLGGGGLIQSDLTEVRIYLNDPQIIRNVNRYKWILVEMKVIRLKLKISVIWQIKSHCQMLHGSQWFDFVSCLLSERHEKINYLKVYTVKTRPGNLLVER